MITGGKIIIIVVALSLLIALTIYAFRPVLSNVPTEWDYLWDDGGNFYQNKHLSLSWGNIQWAVKDGIIHSVYEPVSLTIKMALHSALRTIGVAITAQTYRIINLIAHILNVCLVFLVGNSILVAVNDYEFYECRTKAMNAISGGEKGAHGATLQYLFQHRFIAMLGCWIGSALFAVHPLQAQIIGWASCMSYPFACTFALISYWHYIKHRVFMRRWRRAKREVSGFGGRVVDEPFHLFGFLQRIHGGGKKSNRKSRGISRQAKVDPLAPETFLATRHKIISLAYYFLATFSKAPAIVLPALYVISDVYLFSCPLSVSTRGSASLIDSVANAKKKPARGLSEAEGNSIVKLCRLILRAARAWAIFLVPTPILVAILIRGNKASKAVKVSLFRKIKTAAWALGWYAAKLFVPIDLRATVEMRQVSIAEDWVIGLCLLAIPLATTVLLFRSMKTAPMRVLTCAWGSMVVLLLPALLTTEHSGNFVVAGDRYLYIPLCMAAPLLGALACGSFTCLQQSDCFDEAQPTVGPIPNGVSIAPLSYPIDLFDASFTIGHVDGKNSKKGKSSQSKAAGARDSTRFEGLSGLLFLSCVVSACSYAVIVASPRNLNFWRNSQILWERNLIYNPDSMNGHVILASHYSTLAEKDPGDPVLVEKALLHAEKAVALDPSVYENRFNLAAIYLQREELDESVELFRGMLKDNPRHPLTPRVVVDYAIGLHKMGEWDKAQREMEQAVKMREPRAKGALETILKMRSKPGAEEKQRQWWEKKKEERKGKKRTGETS